MFPARLVPVFFKECVFMNSKKGLSRIMSALLAATSMIGGADVSAGSKRKRKAPGVANGVSRKLSGGSNLYRDLAIGGVSALVGGLLTAAGMHFFGGGVKEKIVKEFVNVLNLDNDLVTGLVEDIGDFLLVFDNSEITFKFDGVSDDTVTLTLDFALYDKFKQEEAGKFLAGRKGIKMYIDWSKHTGNTLPFNVRCYDVKEIDECDGKVGCALDRGLPIELDGGKLPKFDMKFIDKDKVLGRFIRGLVRERLLFLYLRGNKGYKNVDISSDNLAKICWGLWNVPEIKRTNQSTFRNLTGFKLKG